MRARARSRACGSLRFASTDCHLGDLTVSRLHGLAATRDIGRHPEQRTAALPLVDGSNSPQECADVFARVVWTKHCLQLDRLGIVTAWYIWPQLRRQSRADAARSLLILHCFRFVGLSFLVPGVVSPDLAAAWARPAAYGDLIAALLALLALAGLKSRLGIALVWVFNVWGSADLLYAFYQGTRVGLDPGQLGAAYFILTVLVPLLLITHGLLFRLLLQGDVVAAPHGDRPAV
jgi:hypothetical protein